MNKERIVHYLLGWMVLAIFTIALFPHSDLALQAEIPRLGSIATKPYVAPISFEVPKSESQQKREREDAEMRVLAVFEYSSDATAKILSDFHETMDKIRQLGELNAKLANLSANTGYAQELKRKVSVLQEELTIRLSSTAIHHLSIHPQSIDTLTQIFENAMNAGVSEILVAASNRQVSLYQSYHNLSEVKSLLYSKNEVSLIRNSHETTLSVSKIRPRESVIEESFASARFSSTESQGLQSAFYEVLHAFITPNIFYLEKETDSRKKAAAAQINSTKGMVAKGMEILSRGSIVTPDAQEKLEALAIALQSASSNQSALLADLGQSLMLLVLSFVLIGYFATSKTLGRMPLVHFWSLVTIHVMAIILAIASDSLGEALSRSTFLFPEGAEYLWLQPIVLAPVLCTVLFHLRAGLASALFISIHFGMQSNFDLAMSMCAFSSMACTIIFLHQLRYRSHFLISSILGAIMLGFSLVILLLLRNRLEWNEFWPAFVLGASSIITCISVASLFMIHLFEKSFGITTNLTLMELSDFNHPLLKRLSEKAPGSFHHSIMVGNLGEAAAKRIGANPLLVRVIALYHDIGKTSHPEFFTENQKKGENPHDKLNPEDSMNIIRSHVSEGLRLAKEHKIPELIAAGIPEHHGDNVIHYFYRKALQQNLEAEIPIDRFRYPGPRPRSKETALVMLADSIEATSRSMEDPDPAALSKLVQDVIQTRLQENLLRESNLSINDLEEIEIGFLQSLEGMFHTRIQYPEGVFISTKKSR